MVRDDQNRNVGFINPMRHAILVLLFTSIRIGSKNRIKENTAIFWRIRLVAKSALISFKRAMAASWSKLSKALADVSSAWSISLMPAEDSEMALSNACRNQRSLNAFVSPKALGAD